MMNKTRALILSAVITLSLLCIAADSPYQNISKKKLLERVEGLEQQNFALQQQLSDLGQRVDVLTDRMNSMSSPGVAQGQPGGLLGPGAAPSLPPGSPNLDVVVLSPETARAAPAKKRGRVFIEGSEGNHSTLIEHQAPLPGTNYVPPPDPETAESKPAPAPAPSAPPSSPPPAAPAMAARQPEPEAKPSPTEGSAYRQLKEQWDKGEKEQALPLLESYVKNHRKGAHIDEVAYLLGEEHYQRGEHGMAIEYLRIVTEEHPESTTYAPESLYLIGLSYLELGQIEPAADALREVKILYPFSEAAVKADQELAACCQ